MYGKPQNGGSGGLINQFAGLSGIIAVGVTIFIGPLVWPLMDQAVMARLNTLYAYDVAHWLGWVIHVLTYPATFIAIRLSLMAALSALSVFATNRLI